MSISEYYIHNFKNHADTHLQLGNLTLLTGINGSGKSSVFQSMLMLRDSFLHYSNLNTLYLKGDSFNAGRSSDIFNKNGIDGSEYLQLSLRQQDGTLYDFRFSYPMMGANSMIAASSTPYTSAELSKIPLFTDHFQYLSAFRDGPRSIYDSDTDLVDTHHQLSHKNGRGELAVYFLSKLGDTPLPIANLACDASHPLTIRKQTECWLNAISSGIEMKINQHDSQYEILFGYKREGKATQFFSPVHSGFGISYILPVILSILSASPGSLILIENPEAHIHPSGQSALMDLASRAATNGVQVIIETHSDHIVNGALVASKQGHLPSNLLSIYYFEQDEDFNSHPIHLEIGSNGRLVNAPLGFFDQMDTDLEILFDI